MPRVAALARRGSGQRLDGGRGGVSVPAPDLRGQRHCHGRSGRLAQAHRDRAGRLLPSRSERRRRRASSPRALSCGAAHAHPLCGSQIRLHRSAGSANCGAGGIRRPGAGKRGEFQTAVQPGGQNWRRRGRFAGGGRCRLCAERNASRARPARSFHRRCTLRSASPERFNI